MKCAVCDVLAEAFPTRELFLDHVSWHSKEAHRQRLLANAPKQPKDATPRVTKLLKRMKKREAERLRRARDPESVRARSREQQRGWRAAHREQHNAKSMRNYWKHHSENLLRAAIYRRYHAKEIQASRASRYAQNLSVNRFRHRISRLLNLENVHRRDAQYREANREQIRARQAEYRQRHRKGRIAGDEVSERYYARKRSQKVQERKRKGALTLADIVSKRIAFEDKVLSLQHDGWSRKDIAELLEEKMAAVNHALRRRMHKAHPGMCPCEQQQQEAGA